MKDLRLLMTKICNRNCSGCCNKDYDLDNLPVAKSYENYRVIMITGGEPLLFPMELCTLIVDIQMTVETPIYVYTAKMDDVNLFTHILNSTNGITLTIHEKEDIPDFIELCQHLSPSMVQDKSMRLNIFNDTNMDSELIPSYWDYKYIDWIPECPLPKCEEFKRVELFT